MKRRRTSDDEVVVAPEEESEEGSDSSRGGDDDSSERGDSSDASGDEELSIILDAHHRVQGGAGLDYSFRATQPGAIHAPFPSLVHDCARVFSVRSRGLGASAGRTFWVGADQSDPANTLSGLEQLVLTIYEYHTSSLRRDAAGGGPAGEGNPDSYDPQRSGAEWWTQVIDHDVGDIGWHWDIDGGLEEHGMKLHPHLGTVTYLSDVGGPTLVLERAGPVDTETDCCEGEPFVEIARMGISAPAVGKHMVFDGRNLHGASSDLTGYVVGDNDDEDDDDDDDDDDGDHHHHREHHNDDNLRQKRLEADHREAGEFLMNACEQGQDDLWERAVESFESHGHGDQEHPRKKKNTRQRVTLLVNIWVNHQPLSVRRLPAKTRRELTCPSGSCTFRPVFTTPAPAVKVGAASDIHHTATFRFMERHGVPPDIREVPYGIVLPVPVGVQGSGRGATRVIEYAKGFGARLTPSLHDKR